MDNLSPASLRETITPTESEQVTMYPHPRVETFVDAVVVKRVSNPGRKEQSCASTKIPIGEAEHLINQLRVRAVWLGVKGSDQICQEVLDLELNERHHSYPSKLLQVIRRQLS
jgi:hypothetical protein